MRRACRCHRRAHACVGGGGAGEQVPGDGDDTARWVPPLPHVRHAPREIKTPSARARSSSTSNAAAVVPELASRGGASAR